jgi:hypothetical protein
MSERGLLPPPHRRHPNSAQPTQLAAADEDRVARNDSRLPFLTVFYEPGDDEALCRPKLLRRRQFSDTFSESGCIYFIVSINRPIQFLVVRHSRPRAQ